MNEEYGWFRPQDLTIFFRALQGSPSGGVLVGGQALTFWVQFFEIPIPPSDTPFLTQDADFYGSSQDAEYVAKQLKAINIQSTLVIPQPWDHTPNTAIVTFETSDGRKLFVDFLGRIIGEIRESEIKDLAITLEREDIGEFSILHPRHVVISRFANIFSLEEKRTFNGVTQAQVSVHMIIKYFEWAEQFSDRKGERYYLDCFEWVLAQTLKPPAILCYQKWGIDLFKAAPISLITNRNFHERRLPQAIAMIDEVRSKDILAKYKPEFHFKPFNP